MEFSIILMGDIPKEMYQMSSIRVVTSIANEENIKI